MLLTTVFCACSQEIPRLAETPHQIDRATPIVTRIPPITHHRRWDVGAAGLCMSERIGRAKPGFTTRWIQ
ncbi:hypothetical protein GCM10027579_00190 [Calidifontibacter terrae]